MRIERNKTFSTLVRNSEKRDNGKQRGNNRSYYKTHSTSIVKIIIVAEDEDKMKKKPTLEFYDRQFKSTVVWRHFIIGK